ncbi:hypothetical protein EMCRGX_G001910 [Ephydatia muelleri]|eukprot:Em0001g1714a
MADSPDYSPLLKSTPKYASKTRIGNVRNVSRFTWLEWGYVLLVSFSILGVLSLSIKSLVAFSTTNNDTTCASFSANCSTNIHESCDSWTCRVDFIFAVLLLVNLAFCTYYTVDGLFRERGFETLAYVLGVVAVLLYVIINYKMNPGTGSDHLFKLIRLILVCIFAPPNILLAIVVWWRMGRINFLMVGSVRSLLWAYQIRSCFVTLVVFNVELMASVTTLAFARKSTFLSNAEMVVLPVVLCMTILLAIFTILTVSYEWWKAMVLYYFFSLIPTSYYIYKIVNVVINLQDYHCTVDQCSSPRVTYQTVAVVQLFACGLGTLAYFGIIPVAVLTHRNFGKGLKERVPPPFSVNGHH